MTPPKHLSEEAAIVWVEMTENLRPSEMAQIVGPELDAYCGCVASLRLIQEQIAEEGMIVPDSKNQPVPHPGLAIQKQLVADIRAWGRRFSSF